MELVLTATPPQIVSNFAEMKVWLQENLKKYEIEVTEENLPDAKKMATELNKLSTVISKTKSEKIKEITAPVDVFKAEAVEIVDMIQGAREKILAQVKTFEDKTRAKLKELINDEFSGRCNEMAIRPEFRVINLDDYTQLSYMTGKGALSKAAKESVLAKVSEFKRLQDKVDMRLLQLENASLKAGLVSALRREHVESFLMLPDDQYEIQLSGLIGIEVKRQTEVQNKTIEEQNKKPLRFFACAMCRHVVTDRDIPRQCPKCPSQGFKEYPTLTDARNAPAPGAPPTHAKPPAPPPPLPPQPSILTNHLPVTHYGPEPQKQTPEWNQDRLHQIRHHVGDEVFFQMFKIVYQPISDRAIQEALIKYPDLTQGLEWAKGKD